MLAIKLIMEGFGLGFLLYLVCAIGIHVRRRACYSAGSGAL